MSANHLSLRPDRPQALASVMVGGVVNTGGKVYQNQVSILNEGMIIPFLNLPTVFPGCDWATIHIDILGCVRSTQGTAPAGLVLPGWGPLGAPLVLPPYIPIVTGPNVTVSTAGYQVGLPLPSTQPGGPAGTLDAFSTPGNLYRLNFTITPLVGAYGLKRYDIPVGPGQQKIVVVGGFVEAGRGFSE